MLTAPGRSVVRENQIGILRRRLSLLNPTEGPLENPSNVERNVQEVRRRRPNEGPSVELKLLPVPIGGIKSWATAGLRILHIEIGKRGSGHDRHLSASGAGLQPDRRIDRT